jgi:hypothetical protein
VPNSSKIASLKQKFGNLTHEGKYYLANQSVALQINEIRPEKGLLQIGTGTGISSNTQRSTKIPFVLIFCLLDPKSASQ